MDCSAVLSKCQGEWPGIKGRGKPRTMDVEAGAEEMGPLDYVSKSEIVHSYQSHGPITYSVKRPVRNLFSVKGTAVKMVALSFDFLVLNVLHIILVIVFQKYGVNERGADGKPKTDWYKITNEMFAVMSPLLVFFLVFYNNQAYNRYMEQFFIARKLEGIVKYITNRLRAHFRHDPFPGAEQSMREMLRTVIVAHYCLYLRLPRYTKRPIHDWGWDYLCKYGLVKKEEQAVLVGKSGPDIMGETLAFCLERLGQHVRYGHIDTLTFNAFEQDLHVMAGFIMSITAYANNPVPFAYYHLANLLTLGQLALLAYAFVFLDSYLTIVVFALLTIALLGLRDMSCALSDPFGVDDTDFQTMLPTARCHVDNEGLLSRDSVFGNAALPGNPSPPSPPPSLSRSPASQSPPPPNGGGSLSSSPPVTSRRNRVRAGPISPSRQSSLPAGQQQHRSPSPSPRKAGSPLHHGGLMNGRNGGGGGGGAKAPAASSAAMIERSSDGSAAAVSDARHTPVRRGRSPSPAGK